MSHQAALECLASMSFRLIENGDRTLAEKIIHPGFTNYEAADDPEDAERQLRGPAGFLATGTWLRDSFADLQFEEEEVAVNRDMIIAVSTMTGRHTGSFQRIPATGRSFRQRQAHVFHVKDGKIISHRAVRDDLGLLFQLGWNPQGDR